MCSSDLSSFGGISGPAATSVADERGCHETVYAGGSRSVQLPELQSFLFFEEKDLIPGSHCPGLSLREVRAVERIEMRLVSAVK